MYRTLFLELYRTCVLYKLRTKPQKPKAKVGHKWGCSLIWMNFWVNVSAISGLGSVYERDVKIFVHYFVYVCYIFLFMNGIFWIVTSQNTLKRTNLTYLGQNCKFWVILCIICVCMHEGQNVCMKVRQRIIPCLHLFIMFYVF